MKQMLSTLKILTVLSFIIILTSYQIAWAHDFKSSSIEINHPVINKPFVGAKSAAGYLVIRNNSDKEFKLLKVSTTLGRTMLHETTTTEEGVVKMEHLKRVNIPSGEELIMQPGGVHIMIMGILRPLSIGEKIPATLKFSDDLEIDIEFTVREHKRHSDAGSQSKHAH